MGVRVLMTTPAAGVPTTQDHSCRAEREEGNRNNRVRASCALERARES